jgi:hypothetical protein
MSAMDGLEMGELELERSTNRTSIPTPAEVAKWCDMFLHHAAVMCLPEFNLPIWVLSRTR